MSPTHEHHGHGDDHGHGHGSPFIQHHYDDAQHQFDAGKLAIWFFLAQEILFFSALFVAYILYRHHHPEIFAYAHSYLDVKWGAINTAVLIISSLTAVWSVRCAQLAQRRGLILCLAATIVCACGFLGIKYIEYSHKFHEGLLPGQFFRADVIPHDGHVLPSRAHMFFAIYFMMTGLHGLHVVIGMTVLVWVLVRNMRGDFHEEFFTPVEIGALYWHLVDLVWIYLFPLLYLVG